MSATAYFVQAGLQKIVVDGNGRIFRVQPDGPAVSSYKGTYKGTPHGTLTYSVTGAPNLTITVGPGTAGKGEFTGTTGSSSIKAETGQGTWE